MRTLPDTLKTHLETGATTLCQCWLIEKQSGETQGFTDHDQKLTFDGLEFMPETGLSAAEAVSNLGLSVDTSEVDGALTSDTISQAALHGGDYDGARVTSYLVNWQDVDQRIILRTASIGEITCEDGTFSAELRGLMQELNQVQGRIFENACDADLGDRRCQVDLDTPQFKVTGAVTAILDAQTFTASGLASFEAGWFERGLIRWTSGSNAGRSIEIDSHFKVPDGDRLRVWLPLAEPIREGDAFTLSTGCDKLFSTCQAKFANTVNFRGFPHIPGNDTAYRIARADGRNRGQAIIR